MCIEITQVVFGKDTWQEEDHQTGMNCNDDRILATSRYTDTSNLPDTASQKDCV
jgi:hypothetical protein